MNQTLSNIVLCMLASLLMMLLLVPLSRGGNLGSYLILSAFIFLLYIEFFYTSILWYMLPMVFVVTQGVPIAKFVGVYISLFVWAPEIMLFPNLFAKRIVRYHSERAIAHQKRLNSSAGSALGARVSFFWISWLLTFVLLCFCIVVFYKPDVGVWRVAASASLGVLWGIIASLISGEYRWFVVLIASVLPVAIVARLLNLPVLPLLGSVWFSGYVTACLMGDSSTFQSNSPSV